MISPLCETSPTSVACQTRTSIARNAEEAGALFSIDHLRYRVRTTEQPRTEDGSSSPAMRDPLSQSPWIASSEVSIASNGHPVPRCLVAVSFDPWSEYLSEPAQGDNANSTLAVVNAYN